MSGPLGSNLMMHPAAGAGGFYSYQIERSCRFDSGSSSSLSRTIGTPTNIDKFTVSTWVKRGILASSGNYKYA